MEIKGIDIYSHQGEIDFKRVKADGVRFVIIKAGQGLREMGTFRQKYLPAVLAAGLDWGAYWWSDAVTVVEAQKEAAAFVRALDGLRPTYPVYMDQEYESPCGNAWGVGKGKQLRTDMAKAFLKVLEDAGYYAGLYASTNWLQYWVDDKQLEAYDKWVAQYAEKCTYTGSFGMWQHHGDAQGFVGHVDGISVPVDINACYRDYPEIIRANLLNGWTRGDKPGASEGEMLSVSTAELTDLRDSLSVVLSRITKMLKAYIILIVVTHLLVMPIYFWTATHKRYHHLHGRQPLLVRLFWCL